MARTKKTVTPYRRVEYLNTIQNDSPAMISVKAKGAYSNSDDWQDNYQIRINDCENKILLHGKLRTPNSRKNAIHKLDTIIEVLSDFREHIVNDLKKNKLRIAK